MNKLSQGTIDMLTTQYAWTVQSDGRWYREASAAWDHNNPQQFDRVCWSAVGRVCKQLDESLTGDWIQWIVNELRRQFIQGKIDCSSPVPSLFRADVVKAHSARENLFTTQEIKIMNATAFSTKHFVYGQDVTGMTEEQLIDAIKKIEAEIANLKTVKTESKKITDKIKALEVMLGSVVAALDAK